MTESRSARLAEMQARFQASNEAARREFADLQVAYDRLVTTADRLLLDLGPCDD